MTALTLQRLYSTVPAKELKRLAGRDDHLAAALYRPVAYGAGMRLFLWVVFGLSLTAGIVMLATALVAPVAFILIALSVAGVVTLQSMRLTVHTARIAVHAAPALSWLLGYIHAPFTAAAKAIHSVRVRDTHSGLYEKEDIIALFRQQRDQVDNRISERDLDIIEHAAIFNDRQAADILLPISEVKLVSKDEPIGPILLKELHDSGQTSFMVYDGAPQHVVGTLFLRDAVAARAGGQVADLVRHKLSYVHEDFTLRQVLQAFLRTGQHVLVVINSFEEAVGVITLQKLVGELFGKVEDDAQAYDDPVSIAAYIAPKHTPGLVKENNEEEPEVSEPGGHADADARDETPQTSVSSPEATEVVK